MTNINRNVSNTALCVAFFGGNRYNLEMQKIKLYLDTSVISHIDAPHKPAAQAMTTPKYDINSDDPLEMIWAVREKIYEETKDMSDDEFRSLLRQASEWARNETKKLRPENYDFPFLKGKYSP